MAGRILVGTSSWADPGFIEDWYPPGMPPRDRLAWYAERFEAVEVNATFYAVPDERTVARWDEVTPDRFVFDVKVHKLLSRHSADLKSLPPALRDDVRTTGKGRVVLDEGLETALAGELLDAMAPLSEAGKLGAFLVQLSPSFSPRRHDLAELDNLVDALGPYPVALELRHRGWTEGDRLERTLAHLEDRGVAFVGVDAPQSDHFTIMPPIDAVTRDDVAYLRLHGRNAEGYVKGRSVAERFGWVYSDEELEEVAGRVEQLAERAETTHVMFNNNRSDDAPSAAQKFAALIKAGA
jgi:uncharacterized protein YecE (DUF72 family)